jgi:hypothetical protein
MELDFGQVKDTQSFVAIPPGSYACRIAEVRPGEARNGAARWSLRLEVLDGEYAGRTAAWDSLTWSERGVQRVKFVLRVLGFDVSGHLDVEPEDLEGLQALVEVFPEVWEEPETGRRVERLSVPFAGWAPLSEEALTGVSKEEQTGVDEASATGEARGHDSEPNDDTPF